MMFKRIKSDSIWQKILNIFSFKYKISASTQTYRPAKNPYQLNLSWSVLVRAGLNPGVLHPSGNMPDWSQAMKRVCLCERQNGSQCVCVLMHEFMLVHACVCVSVCVCVCVCVCLCLCVANKTRNWLVRSVQSRAAHHWREPDEYPHRRETSDLEREIEN